MPVSRAHSFVKIGKKPRRIDCGSTWQPSGTSCSKSTGPARATCQGSATYSPPCFTITPLTVVLVLHPFCEPNLVAQRGRGGVGSELFSTHPPAPRRPSGRLFRARQSAAAAESAVLRDGAAGCAAWPRVSSPGRRAPAHGPVPCRCAHRRSDRRVSAQPTRDGSLHGHSASRVRISMHPLPNGKRCLTVHIVTRSQDQPGRPISSIGEQPADDGHLPSRSGPRDAGESLLC